MSKVDRIATKIAPYLPDGISHSIAKAIIEHRVVVRVTKPRASKLGDYRPPYNGDTHRISVNGDLNPYSFLVTLLHEFAHLEAWSIQKDLKNPHGKIWKQQFVQLLRQYMHVFPEDVQLGLKNYLANPKASSCSDEALTRVLNRYDERKQLYLEDIPYNEVFELQGGKRFIKREKLRKRYKCQEVGTNRIYYVSPVAEVDIIGLK
ncbi:MAG: sprT domain-containing protein [Flavobacteriales bacterium]|nr:sprT domain-containing protein [Flavobacteriales bacterium]